MFDANNQGLVALAVGYIGRMEFSGQVWFKFHCEDAWLFYRFARFLAESGTTVSLEWAPIPAEGEELAASAHASLAGADDRGRFLHAMLGLIHIEGLEVGDPKTVAKAMDTAGSQPAPSEIDADLIGALNEQVSSLGVVWSPSLYRHGPVTAITLTPAALVQDPIQTAESILAVADNDGIWRLEKP